MKAKYEDSNSVVYSILYLRGDKGVDHRGHEWHYGSGSVATKFGVVAVSINYHYKKFSSTRLKIIFNGRRYKRSYNKAFTKRGATTKAKRFAEEIAASCGVGV